ncbi:MAG: class I SAM-dependent methyltransferase [Pseudomonadota bacterium]
MAERLTLESVASRLDLPLVDRAKTLWFDAEEHLLFERLNAAERDAVLLDVMRILNDESLAASGAHRLDAWRTGWGEILQRVDHHSLSYQALAPQYFKFPHVRLDDDYARIVEPLFEFALCHAVKAVLYTAFIEDGDDIVDLGTGTGANIYLLLNMFAKSRVIGADWAEPSVALVDRIGAAFGERARGARLDMLGLEGRASIGSLRDRVVLSVHAFEQLGGDWGGVLAMLLEDRPKLCIQIEPVLEHYDHKTLLGYLGARYHQKRNYLNGYQSELRRLADAGDIEIIFEKRLPLGTMVHEPYGVLVWRPR